jgi:hypothetical protein
MPVFNVPISLINEFSGRDLTLRGNDSATLVVALQKIQPQRIFSVQLISLDIDPTRFYHLETPVRFEITLFNPPEFPKLYRFSDLLGRHPVRVSVAAKPGLFNASKLALSMNMPVKLHLGQPDPAVVEDAIKLADYSFHGPEVNQPVEFFHSLIMSNFAGAAMPIWDIQEEDPQHFKYVTDQGVIENYRLGTCTDAALLEAISEGVELPETFKDCRKCDHKAICRAYFKFPDPTYDCSAVIELLDFCLSTAAELKDDYQATLGAAK